MSIYVLFHEQCQRVLIVNTFHSDSGFILGACHCSFQIIGNDIMLQALGRSVRLMFKCSLWYIIINGFSVLCQCTTNVLLRTSDDKRQKYYALRYIYPFPERGVHLPVWSLSAKARGSAPFSYLIASDYTHSFRHQLSMVHWHDVRLLLTKNLAFTLKLVEGSPKFITLWVWEREA